MLTGTQAHRPKHSACADGASELNLRSGPLIAATAIEDLPTARLARSGRCGSNIGGAIWTQSYACPPQDWSHGLQHIVTQNKVVNEGRRGVQTHQHYHAPCADFVGTVEQTGKGHVPGGNRRNSQRKQIYPLPQQYRLGSTRGGLDQQQRVQPIFTEPGAEPVERCHGPRKRRKIRAG